MSTPPRDRTASAIARGDGAGDRRRADLRRDCLERPGEIGLDDPEIWSGRGLRRRRGRRRGAPGRSPGAPRPVPPRVRGAVRPRAESRRGRAGWPARGRARAGADRAGDGAPSSPRPRPGCRPRGLRSGAETDPGGRRRESGPGVDPAGAARGSRAQGFRHRPGARERSSHRRSRTRRCGRRTPLPTPRSPRPRPCHRHAAFRRRRRRRARVRRRRRRHGRRRWRRAAA